MLTRTVSTGFLTAMLSLIGTLVVFPIHAMTCTAKSGVERVVLLELYTSEG